MKKTKAEEAYLTGIDRCIKLIEKHKETHYIVEIILRQLRNLKKEENAKIPY